MKTKSQHEADIADAEWRIKQMRQHAERLRVSDVDLIDNLHVAISGLALNVEVIKAGTDAK